MFPPHGNFGLALRENVFIAVLKGAWNVETAKLFRQESTRLVAPLSDSHWAQLLVISEFELSTPDTIPIMSHLFEQAKRHGLVREAIVDVSGSTIKNELFAHSRRAAKSDFASNEYCSLEEGINWLESEGFVVSGSFVRLQIKMYF